MDNVQDLDIPKSVLPSENAGSGGRKTTVNNRAQDEERDVSHGGRLKNRRGLDGVEGRGGQGGRRTRRQEARLDNENTVKEGEGK